MYCILQYTLSVVLLLPLIVLSVPFGNTDDDTKIVGGQNADVGQFPYQISIRRLPYNSHHCGGFIVNERWIGTAAHCTIGTTPQNIIIVYGTIFRNSGGITNFVDLIISHPNFNMSTLQNDVALIKTKDEIKFSETIKPISFGEAFIEENNVAVASGWGRTAANEGAPINLQYINLSTISNERCRNIFEELRGPEITNSSLCTFNEISGEGMCNGDSGGPLVVDNRLIGIVSWGIPCAKGYPDVFSRVSTFYSWFVEQMENNSSL